VYVHEGFTRVNLLHRTFQPWIFIASPSLILCSRYSYCSIQAQPQAIYLTDPDQSSLFFRVLLVKVKPKKEESQRYRRYRRADVDAA
jgi:hypothetical protein